MDARKPVKLIVTNASALRRKYGPGELRVRKALRELRNTDRRRGLDVRTVRIDVAKDMRIYGHAAVRGAGDERAVKAAFEAICRRMEPEYVLILGGPDVVPHQTLRRGLELQDDPSVPSDLPYACAAAYSDDARRFTRPIRAVGRLAGVTGSSDPAALIAAIRFAARWRPRGRRHFNRPLAVSVKIWKGSTRLSLENVFGHARDLQLVPPKSFRWSERLIRRRAHYLNCHGIDREAEFEGQDGDSYPLAHTARYVAPRIREGTVAAVESCYGAQLYDPVSAGSNQPMANAYLRHGAYAYFGSTTATFGPSTGNACADLVCQSFLRHVRSGLSTGRAALLARLEYLEAHPDLAPVDLLTLGQFLLLGDPSVHPVLPAGLICRDYGPIPQKVHATLRGLALHPTDLASHGGRSRKGATVPREARRTRVARQVSRELRACVERVGGRNHRVRTYVLTPQAAPAHGTRGPRGARAVHVARAETGPDPRGRPRSVLVVAQSEGAKVVSLRVLHSKGARRTATGQPCRGTREVPPRVR